MSLNKVYLILKFFKDSFTKLMYNTSLKFGINHKDMFSTKIYSTFDNNISNKNIKHFHITNQLDSIISVLCFA